MGTEFLWKQCLPVLLSWKKRNRCGDEKNKNVTSLAKEPLPESVAKVLSCGPKFCVAPKEKPVRLVSMVRKIADNVVPGEKQRCISEGIECLMSRKEKAKRSDHSVQSTIEYLKRKELALLTADKEGGFVVLPNNMYLKKAKEAICKNFEPFKGKVTKLKKIGLTLCEELNKSALSKAMDGAEEDSLRVFFSAKTHKHGIPFRTIVSEQGTWQGVLSRFLQKQLNLLTVIDPFRIRNAMELVDFLKEQHDAPCGNFVFSIDVEDLFYSIPQHHLIEAVRDHIENGGAVDFQNACGMSINNFLDLLSFYLTATVVRFRDECFIQKNGICIGSCLAPILSEIFLAQCDKRIAACLDKSVVRCFRYVDDFLLILKLDDLQKSDCSVFSILELFNKCAGGLRFTHELPVNHTIQFLELSLSVADERICWEYKPRSKKEVLNYASAHSKLVKRGIVMNSLHAALQKSCPHTIEASLQGQVERLSKADYPRETVASVAEALLRELSGGKKAKADGGKQKRRVAIPYIHRLSHRLKKVAQKCGLGVLFTAPDKLMRLCPAVTEVKKPHCHTKHRDKFVACRTGVVYTIPLACGKMYIGQTGRCVNERLREHRTTVSSLAGGGLLAKHCKRCEGCFPVYEATYVMHVGGQQKEREIVEALEIDRAGDMCVSTPSIALATKELDYLKKQMPRARRRQM